MAGAVNHSTKKAVPLTRKPEAIAQGEDKMEKTPATKRVIQI